MEISPKRQMLGQDGMASISGVLVKTSSPIGVSPAWHLMSVTTRRSFSELSLPCSLEDLSWLPSLPFLGERPSWRSGRWNRRTGVDELHVWSSNSAWHWSELTYEHPRTGKLAEIRQAVRPRQQPFELKVGGASFSGVLGCDAERDGEASTILRWERDTFETLTDALPRRRLPPRLMDARSCISTPRAA